MRKLVFIYLTLFSFLGVMASNGYDVNFKQQNGTAGVIEFTVDQYDFKAVNHGGTDYTQILFDGRVVTTEKGFAELPYVNANIQLGALQNVEVALNGLSYTDVQLDYPLVPSRGVIYRNQDPTQIPYEIAPESMVDAFYPAQIVDMSAPYIIKDVRGTSVYFYPFQYNAVTQTLRIWTKVEVTLEEVAGEPVNPLYQTSGKFFPEMEGMYQSVFMNYENQMDDLTVGETGDILVITTARDEDAIQPYIDWKMMKGYTVHKEVVSTGTNVAGLIQEKYDENNDILYVQLVGDWADIKSNLGGGANAPMDPMLGCVVGTDNFPDIAIGRFSANSAAHVTVQVNKTITYEKEPSGDWYNNAIGVASNQGPGDDNEYDNAHNDIIWENRLEPFTYDDYSYAYDPSANQTMVKNYIEQGASVINYTGHGSSTSWGSSGFSNSNINQLTNGDMLPFIFSVACVNGAFHNSSDCFAEAWLKKENGGAVMTLMSTINQPWDPPMRGQDYFNDMIVGGYNYNSNPGNGINSDEGRTIIGSIVANGLTLMYTEASQGQDLETLQTWTTFGDAALQIRTAEPATVTLSNNVMLVGANFETTVTVGGAAFEGALVALSQEGVYASAYTDASGMVSIPNDFLPGDVTLVVTGFNTETVYETIQCIPPSGPYVIFSSVEVNTASGKLEYGETTTIDLAMKNVGVENATNVEVTISTDDMYVTITDATENFGTIEPDQIVNMENAFEIEVANDIPDGHGIIFNVMGEAGAESWGSSFSLTAVAGVLEYAEYSIMDLEGNNNGKLDPGETVDLYVTVHNAGGASVDNVMGELTSADMYITIDGDEMDFGNVAAGETAEATFTVSAEEDTPAGHIAEFGFAWTADKDVEGADNFITVVGQIPVLIIDMDENNNSANEIAAALDGVDLSYEEATSLPADLNLYSSIFLCLGIYSDNTTLSEADGQALADYLNAGGNLYMEGGDTWYYDDPTAVHAMFGLSGTSDGSGDLGTINGVAGTFTEGMTFNYNGDNNWIDHLEATDGEVILNNASPAYGTAVAYDAGTYKTIGASHEFGGLGESRGELMEAYLNFFDMMPSSLVVSFTADATEGCMGMEVTFTDNSVGATSWNWTFPGGTPGTSTEQNPTVMYEMEGEFDVTLEISNGTEVTEMTKSNYITVMDVPGQAGPIDGDHEVAMGEIEEYHVSEMDDATLYQWEISPENAGTLEVEMNTVTIHFSESYMGEAVLKVCGGNDCGMGAYSEDFDLMVMDPTGIYDIQGATVGIYPNPNSGRFSIELATEHADKHDVKLINALGVEILSKTVEVNGKYTEDIDISGMAEGVYYLYLRNDEQSIVEKIVIQK